MNRLVCGREGGPGAWAIVELQAGLHEGSERLRGGQDDCWRDRTPYPVPADTHSPVGQFRGPSQGRIQNSGEPQNEPGGEGGNTKFGFRGF